MTDWHSLTPAERDQVIMGYKSEGEKTFLHGGTLDECPHRDDSAFAEWWRRGFMNAELGTKLGNKY